MLQRTPTQEWKSERELYAKVGHPYQMDFKNLIKSNIISNWPVTVEYYIRDGKIYGPYIDALKSKNTRTNPDIVIN